VALTSGYQRLGYADSTLESWASGMNPDDGKVAFSKDPPRAPADSDRQTLYQPHLQMKT
jgi:hypothetical protein